MAIQFDGTDGDYISAAMTFDLSDEQTMTVMCWAIIDVDRNAFSTFFQCRTVNFFIQTNSNGTQLILFDDSTFTGSELQVGRWYHLCCTYVGADDDIRVYLDGVLDIGPINRFGFDMDTITFGDNLDFNEPLNGRIGAIKVWSDLLGETEIQDEMYQYVPRKQNKLLNFNPCLADRTVDLSGQGNHWTENGTIASANGPPIVWDRDEPKIWVPPRSPVAADITHVAALAESFDNVVQRRPIKITSF